MTVAEALKRFRLQFGLSQKEVAGKVGMVPTSYYRYESGRFLPQADILIKLADAYDVSVDYLVGRSDIPRQPQFDQETMNLLEALQAWKDAHRTESVI